MALKRYIATQDNTITNAFKANMQTRGIYGNMGQSDVVEVFSIYAQAASSSSELARILVQFPIDTISADRTAGTIPASGSASFYLRMFNAKHSWTTPRDYTLDICPVSRSWCEGLGLDMEDYSDLDASNWIQSCDGYTSACITMTVHATGGFDATVVNPTVLLFTKDPFAVEYSFLGVEDATPAVNEFYLDTSLTNCAANIAEIINISASTDYRATANDTVVTVCVVPPGVETNKGLWVYPGPGSATRVFASVTGTIEGCLPLPPTTQTACTASFFGGADTGGTEGINWTTEGGDYLASPCFSQSFDLGNEDLEVDVTPLVEEWLDKIVDPTDGIINNGVGIKLSATDEGDAYSYYNKMFFARGSQFFFKRPIIEVRWNETKQDHRGNFFLSSSLVPASDNLMNLYLYNVVKGQLTNIPAIGAGNILVSVYSGSVDNSAPFGSKIGLPVGGGVAIAGQHNVTGTFVETGIYSASFAYTSSAITTIFDVWHSGGIEYHTGTAIAINTFDSKNFNFDQRYVTKIINFRPTYSRQEASRFRLYVRQKDWMPTIYTISSNVMPNITIENIFYEVERVSDELKVIPYGTGSLEYTKLSYDVSGSYFDLDMNMLESDTVYTFKFVFLINGLYVEQPEEFRFRVE